MFKINFIQKLEDALEIPSGTLSPELPLDSFPEWDSLAHLNFIALLNKEYNKKISIEDIVSCKTVGDLLHFME
jgi:acyl carrier protein